MKEWLHKSGCAVRSDRERGAKRQQDMQASHCPLKQIVSEPTLCSAEGDAHGFKKGERLHVRASVISTVLANVYRYRSGAERWQRPRRNWRCCQLASSAIYDRRFRT